MSDNIRFDGNEIVKSLMNKLENGYDKIMGNSADDFINKVISGAYESQEIVQNKKGVFIGKKEVSTINCETYENADNEEVVVECKKIIEQNRKKAINPLNKVITENYLIIIWRNGEKSVICVDKIKYTQIVKILS